jgi:hypothetical protein
MRVHEITARAQRVWVGHSLRQAQGRLCPTNADSKIPQAGNFRSRILPAICAALLALAPYAAAQRTAHAVAPHPAIPHFNSPAGSFAFGRAAYASRFRRSSPYTSLPFPFFTDFFNPDDIYSSGYPVASQPPVILLQAARALAGPADYLGRTDSDRTENDREPAIPQPLVIELQNGRYVRVNSTPSNGEALPLALAPDRALSEQPQPSKSTSSHSTRLASSNITPQPPTIAGIPPQHDLQPALLVFRDGHSEEVRDYTIADGTLYARGDYYTDGYWTKKIDLSTLNVAQTLEANTKRDVKFVLPSSPNEVITRP